MSSLARRSLHTTAAIAGIAALGIGVAGHAFAAPPEPSAPGVDTLGAAPDVTVLGTLLDNPPILPSNGMDDLPYLFSFETPTINTAAAQSPTFAQAEVPAPEPATAAEPAPEASTAPASTLPQLPDTEALDPVIDLGSGTGQINGPQLSPQELTETNDVGGMPELATGNTVTSLVGS